MDEYVLTSENNILYCNANGNYTKIFLVDGTMHVLSKKLKSVEAVLNKEFFVRVHHSYLVNLLHAKKYLKKYGGQLLLNNGDIIDVSRSKKSTLFEKLKII